MDENWTLIYSSSQIYKAEILKGFLEENDILSVVINKKDSVYLFGEAELYVKAEDAFRAKQLILKQNIE
jgi:hypothetical protein